MMHTAIAVACELVGAALVPVPLALFIDHTCGPAFSAGHWAVTPRNRRRPTLTGSYLRLLMTLIGWLLLGTLRITGGVVLVLWAGIARLGGVNRR